jgi:hypothetical protein
MRYWYKVIPSESDSYGIPESILDRLESDMYIFSYHNDFLEKEVIIWRSHFVNHECIEVPVRDMEYLDSEGKIGIKLKRYFNQVKKIIIKPLDWDFYELDDPKSVLEEGLKTRIGLSVGDVIEISNCIRIEIRLLFDENLDEIQNGKILNSDIEVDFIPMDNYERISKEKAEEKNKRIEDEKKSEEDKLRQMILDADKLIEEEKVEVLPGMIVFGQSRNLKSRDIFSGKSRKLSDR